jgi:hypothetical protein
MAFRLIKSETVPLTKELAARFASMTPSPTERPLDSRRVKYLREKVEADQCLPFKWASAVTEGLVYRMNGQHSSKLLSGLNGSFPDGLVACVDEFACDTLDDQALLFRQIDQRQSARSAGDNAGAYQGIHSELEEIPRKVGHKAILGVVWYRKHILKMAGQDVPSTDEVGMLFNEESLWRYLQWLPELFQKGNAKYLLDTPVLAAVYATWSVNEEQCKAFWTEAALGDAFDDDSTSPSAVLARWLDHLKRMPKHQKPEKMGPASLYYGCAFAWNAMRDERQIKDIKWQKHLPITEDC